MFPAQLPATRSARWRLLEEIIERWFSPSKSGGVAESEIREAERLAGLELPAALREWYLRFGARCDVWCVQDRLLAPSELSVANGFVRFAVEAQSCWYWGIPEAELGAPDPPVFVSTSGSAIAWERESDSVSRFVLQYAMLNVKFGSDSRWNANGPLTAQASASIEASYAALPFGELHAPVYPTRFYGTDDLLLEVQSDVWLWATARDAESFNRLNGLLRAAGMEWEHVSGA